MGLFGFHKVLEEKEARLRPSASVQGGSSSGKSERKRYSDGEERLKVRARDLDVPDGTEVEISIAGAVVAGARAEDGRIRLDLSSRRQSVPVVADGDVIQLAVSGRPLLEGTFRPD